MRTTRRQSAGFTLIEVVVAITLMSLLMMILFMGLRISANAWRRGEQKMNDRARIFAGADILQRQIAAAVPWSTVVKQDQKSVQLIGFSGSNREARFITTSSWQGDRAWPQYMADYRVMTTPERRQQLVISEAGLADEASIVGALNATPNPEAPAQAIGDPADWIEFSYYRPANAKQGADWVGIWEPQLDAELPRAIQVRWHRGNDVQVATFLIAMNNEPKTQY